MTDKSFSALARRTQTPPISWLMALTLSHPQLISLAAGFTDNESLPVRETREILQELLRRPEQARPILQYGSTPGDPELRKATGDRLRSLDKNSRAGNAYNPKRILVTSGSQQTLYMVTEALCDPGDIVLVEAPTYFVYLGILQSHGIAARGIRLERDGLDLAHLETTLNDLKRRGLLPRVKLLYLVTYFQNPTGATTVLEKKRAALELLKRFERDAGHPIYLLEDAAYRELRFRGSDVPSALTFGKGVDRVIYAGTYSKPFATGVRVGFGVLPEPLLTTVLRVKGNHDFGTANLLQQIIKQALVSGAYDEHLTALRRRYARKAGAMLRAFKEHIPENVEWWEPEGGLYFWVKLPKRLSAGPRSKVFNAALRANVLYVPGELCYADDPTRKKPGNELRVSFGGARLADIPEGVTRLGRVLERALKKRR